MLVNRIIDGKSSLRVQTHWKETVQKCQRVLMACLTEKRKTRELPINGGVGHYVIATILFEHLNELLGGDGDHVGMQVMKLFLHKADRIVLNLARHYVDYSASFNHECYLEVS